MLKKNSPNYMALRYQALKTSIFHFTFSYSHGRYMTMISQMTLKQYHAVTNFFPKRYRLNQSGLSTLLNNDDLWNMNDS